MQALPSQAVLEGTMLRTHVILVTMDGKRFSCPREPLAAASLTLRELFQFQSDQQQQQQQVLEAVTLPEVPLHTIDAHTLLSVYEYIHQKYGTTTSLQQQQHPSGAAGKRSSAVGSSSLERPLRGDLATVLEPWDWKYCVDTLLKGWTPPPPAAMAALAMAAGGGGGDRLASSSHSMTPPPTSRTTNSSSTLATDNNRSNNNTTTNNNVISAALAFGPMSSAAMMNVFYVMNAANTLEISSLRDLCGALIAHCVRNRNEEDIMHLFGVTAEGGSFSKEAEEALCNEFPWLRD